MSRFELLGGTHIHYNFQSIFVKSLEVALWLVLKDFVMGSQFFLEHLKELLVGFLCLVVALFITSLFIQKLSKSIRRRYRNVPSSLNVYLFSWLSL